MNRGGDAAPTKNQKGKHDELVKSRLAPFAVIPA
jgi:hypothetical protein